MATPRRNSIRGTVARGVPAPQPRIGSKPVGEAEPVVDPTRPRRVIEYTLQRRAALLALFNGGAFNSDVCDADPYLLRAAKFHGEPAGACPVCKDKGMVTVTYVFGDQLGPYSGRVRATDELPAMCGKFGEFDVYVVEVCQRCHWNFLRLQYVLGDGVPRRPLPRSRDMLD